MNSAPALNAFRVAELPAGQKRTADYLIGRAPDGTHWHVTVLAVRGQEPGPVLLVNGGTHGDEYEGLAAIQELFASLDPGELRGTWIGVPVLNEPAMTVPHRCGPFDQQDLARTFPGKPEGSLTEQIAYHFSHDLLRQAHYYIDLHSAGSALRMVFLSGYGVPKDKDLLEQQRKMAIAFGADLVWGTPLLPGRTLSQAEEYGIPAIYAETTGCGSIRREDVQTYLQGVQNVMGLLGMTETIYPRQPRRYFRETGSSATQEGHLQIDHPAPCSGLFLLQVDLWDLVREGQIVGRIVDFAGRERTTIRARRSGHVILVRHWPSVREGDPLLVVVEGLEKTT